MFPSRVSPKYLGTPVGAIVGSNNVILTYKLADEAILKAGGPAYLTAEGEVTHTAADNILMGFVNRKIDSPLEERGVFEAGKIDSLDITFSGLFVGEFKEGHDGDTGVTYVNKDGAGFIPVVVDPVDPVKEKEAVLVQVLSLTTGLFFIKP